MGAVASDSVGRTLRTAIAAVGRLRTRPKPLHPAGRVHRAELRRFGSTTPSGVEWLDRPGTDDAVVRMSRAVGLPAPLPDVFGLAVRVHPDARPIDLLLSTTGTGPASRYLLRPAAHPLAASYSTLMPYRSGQGALLIAARPLTPGRDPAAATTVTDDAGIEFTLEWSRPRGDWHPFAELVLDPEPTEESISFDAILNPPPGLSVYDWARRMREPSYARARRQRRGDRHGSAVGR